MAEVNPLTTLYPVVLGDSLGVFLGCRISLGAGFLLELTLAVIPRGPMMMMMMEPEPRSPRGSTLHHREDASM